MLELRPGNPDRPAGLCGPAPAADAVNKPQGEKPILVMIHGMFVRPWCWDSFRTYFEARGYKVVTPTLRYHNIPLSSRRIRASRTRASWIRSGC